MSVPDARRTPQVVMLHLGVLAALVVLVGCGANQPLTSAGQHDTALSSASAGTGTPPSAVAAPVLAAPVSFDVKRLDITAAPLVPLGLQPNGTVAVPPVNKPLQGGYWKAGAPTGNTPTVILAHVNGGGHPGLFAHLDTVAEGDTVTVHRADAPDSHYVIVHTEQVDKDRFPTAWVYGDQPAPTLRLVTCGGVLNTATHSYEDNIIAFGELTT